ncbi:MAG: putative zinc-binding metallopeptidase [Ilumatobacteraceae bacterium]
MRVFHCDCCGHVVAFSDLRCEACQSALGYVDDERMVRVLEPDDAGTYRIKGRKRPVWRCLNAAWGCNWIVAAASGEVWCRSCQLTRGRPDEAQPDAVEAWMIAESAKRRLVHQLDELALPIEIRSTTAPDGLAFDLVYLPGTGGITGHLDGVVTLDLAETEDHHREDLRLRLNEPFRTVIGHLRHEIAHHYWVRLVGQTNEVRSFRRLFGDERADYAEAVERYYAGETGTWDPTRFVTPYAACHPLEDWAETFAHYLHIIDAVDTAVAHDLIPTESTAILIANTVDVPELGLILDAWRPINVAVNAIAESLGAPSIYPFEPVGAVVDKLAYVHQQIIAHTERDRFYAND